MVKVKLEQKRGRLVLHLGTLKLECTIEPRRWRNPLLAVAVLLLLPPLFFHRPDILTLLTTANMYACVAIPVAWQMVGIGRMNFGPQIFIGVGGFTAALLSIHWGLGPLQSMPFVILIGLIAGFILSPLTIVARGLYFSIITLVLPLVFMQLTYVFSKIFGGEYGLSGVRQLVSLGSMKLNFLVTFYLSLLMMLVFMFIVNGVLKSRMGLFAAAINDDEDVANALGLNVNWWKIMCYSFSSIMVALTGLFMAYNVGGFSG
jgi:branched-chain amino acid transport system permease protein